MEKLQRLQFVVVGLLVMIQSVMGWEYLGQDEDIYWISLFAFGVLIVILMVGCCNSSVDPYLSPIHPYVPRNGLYIAEYREPDGVGKRHVYLTFEGDEERGWRIVPQNETTKGGGGSPIDKHSDRGGSSDRLRKLCVTGGYMDISGKLWWKETGPGTEVESYGRYDLSRGTFTGTWLATYNIQEHLARSQSEDNVKSQHAPIIISPSKGKNVRRVKYTKFYHAESYAGATEIPEVKKATAKELSKLAEESSSSDDYVNIESPNKNKNYEYDNDVDAVMSAREVMAARVPSNPPPRRTTSTRNNNNTSTPPVVPRGQADPPMYGRNTARGIGAAAVRMIRGTKFDRQTDRSPSPDPDYVKIEDAMSIPPLGNDDATMNSDYEPSARTNRTTGNHYQSMV